MDAKRIKLSDGENGYVGSNTPIRTLCVSPVNVDMSDQIKCYFERFGTVNSVEISQEDNRGTHFAFVEFKIAESAAAVLSSNGLHRINDFDVQVKAAEPWHQPDHILNALDDDCLRMILLELNQKDLTNAANVCVRFNEQARSVFSTKFEKLDFTQNTGDEIEHSLKAFGPVVQSLDVTSRWFSQNGSSDIEILQMIVRYCTTELKELTFHDFGFENHMLNINVKFYSVFSKLERLTFFNCHLRNSLNGLLTACVDLKVLRIERCHQICVLWPGFSKLEELQLVDTDSSGFNCNSNFMNDIISLNSKLTKISFIEGSYCRGKNSPKMIRAIDENNLNLLELEFICKYNSYADFSKSIRCLSRLTSLKVLKLHLNLESAAPLCAILTGLTSIEHLKLVNGMIDTNLIETISKMKQLKVLELRFIDGLTDEHLIVLAKGLGFQLEKLELDYLTANNRTTTGLKEMLPFATKLSLLTMESTNITIWVHNYKGMLATVQKRPAKNSFLIELTGGQVRVDETVLMENRDNF